jgi:hypothetical protein
MFASCVTLASWAQSAPVLRAREEVKPLLKAAPSKPQPVSVTENLPSSEVVRLEAPDLTAVLAEDAAAKSAAKGPQRIGIRRALPNPVDSATAADGSPAWRELEDGRRLRAFTLESEAAVSVRIHFEGLSLPVGATLLVFNADNPTEVVGPYDAAFAGGRGEFWSESVFGSRATVECLLPAGMEPARVRFAVREIIHGYVSLDKLARPAGGGAPKAAGACNNDVTCFPDWAQTSRAVAGLGSISDQNDAVWCTGCLVADTDPGTFIDYFLTANHCVGSQYEANDLEFYWFYQTSTCDGAAPGLATVPRTGGGADFLAGAIYALGNDFTFLRLRQATPAGVTYAAWSPDPLVSSQPVIVVHHPDGDFKRISFGNQAGSDPDFWDVLWHDGTTEPGSSGSPLFNANHEIMGQLYGGLASCTNMLEVDSFGRFDATFPVVQDWLLSQPAGAPNDAFADALAVTGSTGSTNASSAGATRQSGEPTHVNNTYTMSIWFDWTAPAAGRYRFDTVGSRFDTLLAVYTGSAVNALTLVGQNDDVNTAGGIVWSQVPFLAAAGTTYRIAVDGYTGQGGSVTLNWARWNDFFADALVLSGAAGDAGGLNAGATKETGEPSHAGNPGGASVWYRWTAPANGTVTFDTEGSSIDTLLAVYTGTSVSALGTAVAFNDDLDYDEGIFTSGASFTAVAGTTYQIAVDGYDGETGFVMLTWNQPPAAGSAPANNNFGAAQALTGSSGTLSGSNRLATKEAGEPTHAGTTGGKSVWYQWTAPGDGQATLDTLGSEFDTVLAVYTGGAINSLTTIASNDDFTASSRASQVSFAATAGTTYRIAVDGYQTQSGTVREGAVTVNWSQTLPPTPPGLTDPQVLPNGQFQLTVNGIAGRTYAIDYSTDLSGWTELGTLTLSGTTGTFTDTTAPGHSPRFYRARLEAP